MAGDIRALLSVAALAIGAANATAQSWTLVDGDRVRITAPSVSPRATIGLVQERKADTIVVRAMSSAARVVFPTAAIEKLERSDGARSCSGVIPGLLVGGLLAAAIIVTDDTGGVGLLVSPIAALLGYAVTTFVARLFTCERWTVIPVPQG